jgi:hypothetical protein
MYDEVPKTVTARLTRNCKGTEQMASVLTQTRGHPKHVVLRYGTNEYGRPTENLAKCRST